MRIFADSACDLPKSFFEENDVTLIPLRVLIDDKEYDDIVSIDSKEVYKAIRNGKQPKTSQASPELFLKMWKELAKFREDGIYITFSSELSGTHSTAVMIRDQVKETNPTMNLVIIDSRCASLGYGLLVKEAVRLREAGDDVRTIERKIRSMAGHMEHLFTVEDLDYMARGGRVSKASAFIGGLLNIKPLLHVEGGKLVPIEKHRGRKKVLRRIVDLMAERGDHLAEQTIAISHGDDESIALELQSLVQEMFQPKNIEIHLIGSVVGSHAGPGTVAVFFLNKLND
ncbi:DegV family protein [Sporosarcina limicola]|uniref:DegV family protein with EDD domain n=1 Tax=Sporosarcina limicola TaxID=34101 RepID=A0A927MP89_9BACL|nr:DegV family protein [Sporosarcina limicola]MBE1555054.1 DegV family protein with EDD domain [Sporosarcina limicola]